MFNTDSRPYDEPINGLYWDDKLQVWFDDEPLPEWAVDMAGDLDAEECIKKTVECWLAQQLDDVTCNVWDLADACAALEMRMSEADMVLAEIDYGVCLAGVTHYGSGAPYHRPLAIL